MARISIDANVPLELLAAFTQVIRTFERQHPEQVEVCIQVDVREATQAQMLEMIRRMDPPFAEVETMDGTVMDLDQAIQELLKRKDRES
jgi:RNase adaptor protein for sRNA GlmZ degradation